MSKVVPEPMTLSTSRLPSCASVFFCAMASPSPVPPEGEERPSWLVEVQGDELGEVGVVLDDEDLLAHNISRVRSGRLQAW